MDHRQSAALRQEVHDEKVMHEGGQTDAEFASSTAKNHKIILTIFLDESEKISLICI